MTNKKQKVEYWGEGSITEIVEGYVSKGGSNTAPTTPHPATSIQGFGPLPRQNGASPNSRKKNQ